MIGALRRFFLLTAILAVSACAAPSPPALDRVPIAPGVTLALPGPGGLGRTIDAVQMVTARRGADIFVFEGRLSAKADSLILVGTDSMGRRAMTLRWNGTRLEVERASWLPDSLHPENILADIMLLYWPEAALRPNLTGADIVITQGGRQIRRDGAELIAVRYDGDPWSGTATLRNLVWDYEIEVRSMVMAP